MAAGGNGWLCVWNGAEAEDTPKLLFSRKDSVYEDVALSGDGRLVVAHRYYQGSTVYEVSSGRRLCHMGSGSLVAMHPLGTSFVSYSSKANQAWVCPTRPPEATYSVASGSLTGFSAEGSHVASTSGVYEASTGMKTLSVGGRFMSEGSVLARLNIAQGTMQLLDVVSGRESELRRVFREQTFQGPAAISSDGRYLAATDSSGAVGIWESIAVLN